MKQKVIMLNKLTTILLEIIDTNGDPKAYRLTDETTLAISELEKRSKSKV
ncbi:hypothetical protein KHA80_00220 [Anaerobacillus sp. HL2]|nr:hypothetical protein KHA80_00220 [Anaerobacillus sp. HL2]